MPLRQLGAGAWYRYEPSWLSPEASRELQRALTEEVPWEQRPIRMFGREILQPRLIGWAGALPYRYSGQTLPPRAGPDVLRRLLERVVDEVGVAFNHILLNRYRDGRDHMGRHADDEPELGREPVIAAVSLGAKRRFRLEKKGSRTKRTQPLADGSLLVMGGTMQHRWYHAVLKETGCTAERINVTFRLLRGPPGTRQQPQRQ
ncbi:MAG: alpha-ketoglutarate-dependent dioxygenase AlkB [Myxococcales bacterium]|nr:alpha-ketoglutarate-dependent dioxygenase AlkB [Myxococcales bacterium]